MTDINVILFLSNIFVGCLMIVMFLPLLKGKVKIRNPREDAQIIGYLGFKYLTIMVAIVMVWNTAFIMQRLLGG